MVSGAVSERSVPSGTIAFLFTDVESSVARWEKYRDAMREAIERHDMLLCTSIEADGGYVFKTVGDAVCAAFATADAAVNAAVRAQHTLQSEDWSAVGGLPVRMAVHSGAAELRDGDYFGQSVNRVARLLSLAHGGQILVSGIAKELCEGTLSAELTLRDLGAHRLRDLAHPEQVYQVIAASLPAKFPPLRSLEALPNNLPLQLTPFFGRQTEIEEIERALEHARLVTLVGSGGVGKTRLALQAGADLVEAFRDGVWFVDLAVLRDGAATPRAIAEVLGVELDPGNEPLAAIVAALRSKQLLLVLDNCEHVISVAAHAAEAILRECRSLRILATSREGLGIGGERAIRVPSLEIPQPGTVLSAAAAMRYAAVALFADRAQAANAAFALTDENWETVVDVCRRLDGIALAIELAAARLKVLSLHQLASRLNERFRVLTGGSRNALPRQQTMRALIDWSYDLLSDAECTLFRRSAVFAGSFTLDAVAGVCSDETSDAWDPFDVLASLVEKSMITCELAGSEQRYRLLESARQYALERLVASGEEQNVRSRHAHYYRDFSIEAERRYFTTPLKLWFASVDPEADNVRAALQWLIEHNEWQDAAALAGAFVWYWIHSKQIAAPIATLERIVGLGDAIAPRELARCWYVFSYLLDLAADENRARAAAANALVIARREGDRASEAHALICEASAAFMDFEYDSETAFTKALEIFTGLGNQRMVGIALGRRARSLGVSGRLEAAMPLYERALSIGRAAGDDRTCSQVLNNLAETAFNTGQPELALRYAGEALEYAMTGRNEKMIRVTYANMVAYLLHLDMVDDASDRARIALELAPQNSVGLSLLAVYFAAIAAERERFEEAAVLIGHFLHAFQAAYGSDRQLELTERNLSERITATLREKIAAQRFQMLFDGGAVLTVDEAANRMRAIT